MKYIVDVVNLNADASCLSSKWWLKILEGGKKSYLYEWLSIYIKLNKKISLGITGSTISDIVSFNPESIELINSNRNIFEIIVRPYAHDIALLRTGAGFKKNLDIGIETIKKEFEYYTNYYLPPEFMLTNEQIYILSESAVQGTFINSSRFKKEIKSRLSQYPYKVKGLFGSEIACLPFADGLTKAYLNSIHFFDSSEWNNVIENISADYIFSWRDGESSFFVPEGNSRERIWLENESKNFERVFISECIEKLTLQSNDNLIERQYHFYPVHSFTAWMKEFRMLGFINKVKSIEDDLEKMPDEDIFLWLQVINSDILSSIEKDSPKIKIKLKKQIEEIVEYTIWRSERGFEGEEILAIIEKGKKNNIDNYKNNSSSFHILKLMERIKYLKSLKQP